MIRPAMRACTAAAFSLLVAACASQQTQESSNPAPGGAASSSSSSSAQPGAVGPQQAYGQYGQKSAGAQEVPGDRSVYYDLDRSDIKPQYRGLVQAHARYLQQHSDAKIVIEGNGDERGSREYNLALGQRRAEAVRKMMRLSGVADRQMEAISYG